MNCLSIETDRATPKQWSAAALKKHAEASLIELGEGNYNPRIRWYLAEPIRIDRLQRAMFALAIERWVRSGKGRTYSGLARVGNVSIGSIERYRKGHSSLTERTDPIVRLLIADRFLPTDFTLKRSSKYPRCASGDQTGGASK